MLGIISIRTTLFAVSASKFKKNLKNSLARAPQLKWFSTFLQLCSIDSFGSSTVVTFDNRYTVMSHIDFLYFHGTYSLRSNLNEIGVHSLEIIVARGSVFYSRSDMAIFSSHSVRSISDMSIGPVSISDGSISELPPADISGPGCTITELSSNSI